MRTSCSKCSKESQAETLRLAIKRKITYKMTKVLLISIRKLLYKTSALTLNRIKL